MSFYADLITQRQSQLKQRSKSFPARGDGQCVVCDTRYRMDEDVAFVRVVWGNDFRDVPDGRMKAHATCAAGCTGIAPPPTRPRRRPKYDEY